MDAELLSLKTLIVIELLHFYELCRDSVTVILMNPIGSGKTIFYSDGRYL